MKFYSWKDIERFFYKRSDLWGTILDRIEVYPDVIVLYKKDKTTNDSIKKVLDELFPKNFNANSGTWMLRLDMGDGALSVSIEESVPSLDYSVTPIFKDILYRKSSYPAEELTPLCCPVIAFHSYKGGVGRTLSLLAFAKAWSECFKNEKQHLLIVDADIEAPGLTWLNQNNMGEDCFSYLDLLDILQDAEDIDTVVALAKTKLYGSNIEVMTDEQSATQTFLPTYRYVEQLLDMYATPNTIVNIRGKNYALADTLAQLGQELGASAVLVDLRAGLSDYSSTLLFDPRVKKYLVTSTSEQSVKGTELLLGLLNRGLKIDPDAVLPEIFLNMVMRNLEQTPELEHIIDRLKSSYYKEDMDETDTFVDNFLIQIPFASELIHLSSLKQIFQTLSDRSMFVILKELVKVKYDEPMNTGRMQDRSKVLKSIYNFANSQLTAENGGEFKVLMTKSLQFLLQQYIEMLPQIIITGAKGAGKTFLFMQMVQAKKWDSFCRKIKSEIPIESSSIYFLPILSSKTIINLQHSLTECINECKLNVSSVLAEETAFLDNINKVQEYKDKEPHLKESVWIKFWDKFLAEAINPEFSTLQMANESLIKENKRIILLFDGLEEIFKHTGEEKSEQIAISTLCQDVFNRIKAKCSQIGIIIFLRYDMAKDAISVNFTQFMDVFEKFALKWSQEEALRLALWLVKEAVPRFMDNSIDIVSASKEIVEKNLTRLWGLKLGKNSSNEAYTSRWVLAALSDFNGQLQARDIIRFLKYATQHSDFEKKFLYDDRYIMPQEIRDAVIKCSNEKIQEINLEYHSLEPIFKKLENHKVKTLPLTEENNPLERSDREKLEDAGFLKKDGNKYYLPEIIRHALGYRYEKGARPKVLSLLIK